MTTRFSRTLVKVNVMVYGLWVMINGALYACLLTLLVYRTIVTNQPSLHVISIATLSTLLLLPSSSETTATATLAQPFLLTTQLTLSMVPQVAYLLIIGSSVLLYTTYYLSTDTRSILLLGLFTTSMLALMLSGNTMSLLIG